MAASDVEPVGDDARTAPSRTFRPELQGLRAVAILMVVCYHVWFDRVSGGVDIFLLISAFLLTGSFARKLESGRPLAVPTYWLHAFKRLVPPGAIVIAATLIAVVLILPPSRFDEYHVQALASLTYWENWHLAFQGTDYYAATRTEESPFQHFWSLSIQGQVFLLWPLLFLAVGVLVRRFGLPARRTLFVAFAVLAAASFVWSVVSTSSQQEFAYFDTRTRLWEFALGSLLALALPRIESSRLFARRAGSSTAHPVRIVAGWVGIALILSCGFLVDVQGAFPGWIALWPLLAASLVIGAGATGSRWGVDGLLGSATMQRLGDISYALYLVHWPILIITAYVVGTDELPLRTGILVVLASVLLGWLVTRLVDTPVRTWKWAGARAWRSAAVIALALVIGGAPVIALHSYLQRPLPSAGSATYPGAAVLEPGTAPAPKPPRLQPFVPALDQVEDQWVWLTEPCDMPEQYAVPCDRTDSSTGADPRRVVAYGNSHAQQFLGTLVPTARAQGWDLERPTTGGCGYVVDADQSEDCNTWNERVRSYVLAEPPSAVLLVSTSTSTSLMGDEVAMPGYAELAQEFLDAGIDVISVRDTPRFLFPVPDCVSDNGFDSNACGATREQIYASTDPTPEVLSDSGARTIHLDISDELCPEGWCAPVIGNVLVYFDDNHMTEAYATTVNRFVDRSLREQGFIA